MRCAGVESKTYIYIWLNTYTSIWNHNLPSVRSGVFTAVLSVLTALLSNHNTTL